MTQTTIAISKETKSKLQEFKLNGETFDELLMRLYKSANERLLQDFLMDDTDCLTLNEARASLLNENG